VRDVRDEEGADCEYEICAEDAGDGGRETV